MRCGFRVCGTVYTKTQWSIPLMSSDELRELDKLQTALEQAAAREPIPKIPVKQTYSLRFHINPQNGVWYLSAKCGECRGIAPLLPDPFSGRNAIPFEDAGGEFEATCPRCGARIGAKADDVFAYRWIE
jgi:hypothetical protein